VTEKLQIIKRKAEGSLKHETYFFTVKKFFAGRYNLSSVSQPPCRGPVPGPVINYTGPREVLLEFVILVF